MKITVNIDCTPSEARSFLGLPDTEALQQEMLEKMREHFLKNLDAMNPEDMMKLWMPGGKDTMQQMQDAFMAQMAQFSSAGKK